jgi:putative regulator of septum formation
VSDCRSPIGRRTTISTRFTRVALLFVAVLVGAAACTGSSGKSGQKSVSVFTVSAGQCFVSPTSVHAELSKLSRTPCNRPHNQEAYAIVGYQPPDGKKTSDYPGSDPLTQFAQGACAQRFGSYVGINYLDSKLYFTFLLPSPRGWQQADDHNVICFVTTAGGSLTSSVKGSKK